MTVSLTIGGGTTRHADQLYQGTRVTTRTTGWQQTLLITLSVCQNIGVRQN